MGDVSQILEAIGRGDRQAANELLPLVYEELRRLAAQRLASERPGQTLEPTALVHEAYLRLVGSANANGFVGRRHFFAAAAEAMRRILIDSARRKAAFPRVAMELDALAEVDDERWLELNDALERFGADQPIGADLVKLRLFSGLSVEEAAEALDLSRAQAYREWTYARAWLATELAEDSDKT